MRRIGLAGVVAAICFGIAMHSAQAASVTVYAVRATKAEKAAYEAFGKETGIAVNLVEGKADELIGKLAEAGGNPEADLFVTVDGGILSEAAAKGVIGGTDSPLLRERVPVGFRARDGAWAGVTYRARVIVYARDRVKPSELSSYMALAGPEWKGRVLVRGSGNLYNVSLTASLIAAYGEAEAKKWVDGIAANLAREPKGGDRDQAKGVASGDADVAIMNSYYLGHMLNSDKADEKAAAEAVGVFFPDQDRAGTHVNVFGAGVVKGSKNAEAALRLVEYLVSEPVQAALSAGNFEFPVNPKAAKAPLLAGWGDFKTQNVDFACLYANKAEARAILEASSWK